MNNFRRRVSSAEERGFGDSITGRGYIGDYEAVDLGLPSGLLWATWNVGATKETEYGDYYKHTSAYTATQVMGSEWRMPTEDEFQELINNTTLSSVTISGINGVKFTSNNNTNAYVFFHFTGYYYRPYGSLYNRDSGCYVWTSTAYNGKNAYALLIFATNILMSGANTRYDYGLSVRGVHAAV